MKYLTFLLLLIFSSFTSPNLDSGCVIHPQKGINNILIKESTLKDALNAFGKNKITREWRSGIEFELIGRFEYTLAYLELGITFYQWGVKRAIRAKNGTIEKIILTKSCNCKTIENIGMGSSYEDVINAYGAAYLHTDKKYSKKTNWLLYEKQDDKTNTVVRVGDNFEIVLNGKDTLTNKVIEIRIY